MGDIHAWADTFAWNPHESLETQQTVGHLYQWGGGGGGADFRYVVSHETHTHMVTYQNRIVTIPGTPPIHPDAFKRPNTLPMCGLSWRKPRNTQWHFRYVVSHETHTHMVTYQNRIVTIPGTPPIHPDAFKRLNTLPMCGLSWRKPRNTQWQTSVHGTSCTTVCPTET